MIRSQREAWTLLNALSSLIRMGMEFFHPWSLSVPS